jgi:hypothetical protein
MRAAASSQKLTPGILTGVHQSRLAWRHYDNFPVLPWPQHPGELRIAITSNYPQEAGIENHGSPNPLSGVNKRAFPDAFAAVCETAQLIR